jgi:CRP/FNR family transcriptional regulator, cyclic AMP receptor protein
VSGRPAISTGSASATRRWPLVLVEGDLRPWPPTDSETSVGILGRKLAVIAMIEVTAATLAAHPFLHGMSPDHLAMLARAASDVTFPAGHRFFDDGGHATCFWLVQSGHVTVDVDVPGQGRVPIDTIGMGQLVGWSWLFPPFIWAFGAVAANPVESFEFDARTVRAWCASDPALGYEVTWRVAEVLTRRLKSTRSRLITVSMQPIGTR